MNLPDYLVEHPGLTYHEDAKACDMTPNLDVEPMHPVLAKRLKDRGMTPFTHQSAALRAIHEGQNLILATATSSGKTEAFNTPVFEALLEDPEATALYLYPLKALARDQESTLEEWFEDTGLTPQLYVYDGDNQGMTHRNKAREYGRIILSNPIAMHAYLGHPKKWRRFLGNLRYLIIDEAHTQRGVKGSHCANIIRRILRLSHHYGANPRVILATATVQNPAEFAEDLTGESNWRVVATSGAPTGPRGYHLLDPGLAPPGQQDVLTPLLDHLFDQETTTLVFVTSRRLVEEFTAVYKVHFETRNAGDELFIDGYRGGYTADDRRHKERQLNLGRRRIVFSTNALEAGIDIGTIDNVIVYGFPGTIASFKQMIGRAGRGIRAAHVYFIAQDEPLDAYLANHPDELLHANPEMALIDPSYDRIHAAHLLCAAYEHPISVQELDMLPTTKRLVQELIDEDMLYERSTSIRFIGQGTKGWRTGTPQGHVNVMAGGDEDYLAKAHGELIEYIPESKVWTEAWPGAILLNQGRRFRVLSHDSNSRIVRLEREPRPRESRTKGFATLSIPEAPAQEALHQDLRLNTGKAIVTRINTAGVVYEDGRIIDTVNLEGSPPHFLHTNGFWLEVHPSLFNRARLPDVDHDIIMHGIANCLHTFSGLKAMTDNRDFLTHVERPGRNVDQPAIFILDAIEGGMQMSMRLAPHLKELLTKSHELVSKCTCPNACTRCVLRKYSPDGISRHQVRIAIEAILNALESKVQPRQPAPASEALTW